MRERVLLTQVFAVTRRVLRHQDQFLYTFFGQLMCFSDDRAKAPAAKVSAHLGNETEGTGAIAAFGDLDERIMGRRSKYTRRRFVIEIRRALIAERNNRKRSSIRVRIANSEDVIDLTGTDEGVNLGHFRFQFIAITLDQTAGNY